MVFSLSHYLSGVGYFALVDVGLAHDLPVDCHRGLRPSTVRRLLGGNSIVGHVTASTTLQFAEAGRDILLQHEPHST